MKDARPTTVKVSMAEWWETSEQEARDADHLEVVHEDSEVIVVADHAGNELREWADALGVDVEALSEWMHDLAGDVTDYDWGAADPLVFDRFEQ